MLLIMTLLLLFVILFDRKMLASVQGREGPVVVAVFGFLQAPIDGFKIFLKSIAFNRFSLKFIFFLAPVFVFFLTALNWLFLP